MIHLSRNTKEWNTAKGCARKVRVRGAPEAECKVVIKDIDEFYWRNGQLFKTWDGYRLNVYSNLYFEWIGK